MKKKQCNRKKRLLRQLKWECSLFRPFLCKVVVTVSLKRYTRMRVLNAWELWIIFSQTFLLEFIVEFINRVNDLLFFLLLQPFRCEYLFPTSIPWNTAFYAVQTHIIENWITTNNPYAFIICLMVDVFNALTVILLLAECKAWQHR